ncbi:papain fold toxin domain-containing protein [Enterococcus sp. CWB-B31]|uniref:papain fold toxin domain-containing protein n=1 Tax=Enterococcus sp. CWB-B31 TaxID=2885159 RepID=UPI001E521D2E|nr:papain fold toxin domain-containing protein [Enterococcus sp. CWB-B31]MCB5955329.1 hypothetical protein [Enterococcus sp. CWB-B31]
MLDYLFGTDRVGYFQDWREKSKAYVIGQYTGDVLSLVTGVAEVLGGGLIFSGGSIFSVGMSPFTGGTTLTLIPISVGVSTMVAGHGTLSLVSAVGNLGNGHNWDPDISNLSSNIEELVDQVPSEYKKNGQCDKFADALEELLKEAGIDYKRLKVRSEYGIIYSDKAEKMIGNNGYHDAIKIGDKVYDNLTLNGMEWTTVIGC